ncbi:MAG TPA: hypothetical protein DCX54_09015 [Flavobacteriales bacterium]|nr:hypothetical protein [Flavobacteriales bacterium]
MIQRVQTIYLLISLMSCFILLYIPMGTVAGHGEISYYLNGFSVSGEEDVFYSTYFLSGMLVVIMLLQAISVFDFKNRKRQVILVQISLILLLGLTVGILMYPDISEVPVQISSDEFKIDYNWWILFMILPWVLTYLAIRAIKRDEALVRSTERMR